MPEPDVEASLSVPDDAVTINPDGTITISAAFIREALENPEVAAAVTRRMSEHHETREEALRRIIVTGAKEMLRHRAERSVRDGQHRTRGFRRD